ncbi:MAG: trigger factor [Oscillospiraceae bacterium]|jgi:trigger factor
MNVKEMKKKDHSIVEFILEMDGAGFDKALEQAYQKTKQSIHMPGFRPGKVPRKVVESRYGANAFYEDAINDIMPQAIDDAIEKESLELVGQPNIEIMEAGKDGLKIKVDAPVYPEVHLRHYKGVPSFRLKVEIKEQDVLEEIEKMRQQAAWLEPVERPLQEGDTAVVDYEGFNDGVPFEGGKAEMYDLVIGSGSFVPGFEDQLIGMQIGEEKDIDITFPEDYHADLAGKDVVFHVKLRDVKEKKLPELDDEFAKDVSEFETFEAFKADRAEKLRQRREDIAKQTFENQALRHVVDYMDADIPDIMVDNQVKRMVDEFAMEIASQGMQLQDYLNYTKKTIEDLYNETRGGALYRVQLNVAMKEIVKLENIEPSDEEVEEEIKRLAATYHMPEERVRAAVPVKNLKEDLALRKAADFVVEHAVEKGSEPPKEGQTVVVTKDDCEPEHHHHEEEEPAEEETQTEKKTTRKRAAKAASPEEEGEEKPKKRTTKKAATEEKAEPSSEA